MIPLEKRVSALEEEVALLRAEIRRSNEPPVPWWEKIAGTFANDPFYEEAMRLGREYRQGKKSKPKLGAKRTHGRARHRSS
jgi:hypothetical protein